jgi:hypothetical protein
MLGFKRFDNGFHLLQLTMGRLYCTCLICNQQFVASALPFEDLKHVFDTRPMHLKLSLVIVIAMIAIVPLPLSFTLPLFGNSKRRVRLLIPGAVALDLRRP